MEVWKNEFQTFVQNISIRSVPMIFKARETAMKMIWVSAAFVSVAILFWQLTLLFTAYTSFSVSTVYGESDDPVVFPAISLCNLQPSLGEFDYEQYINNKHFINLAHTEKDSNSANSCYNNSEKLFNDLKSCDLEIAITWHPKYYRCNTLKFPDNCSANKLFFLVYLNYFDEDMYDFDFFEGKLQIDGVRISINHPNSYPNMMYGFNIGSGTDTLIKLTLTKRAREKAPYNKLDCYSNKDENLNAFDYKSCIDQCTQKRIIATCKCFSSNLMPPIDWYEHSACGNTSEIKWKKTDKTSFVSFSESVARLCCEKRVMKDPSAVSCWSKCLEPCEEYVTETLVNSNKNYPHYLLQLNFYNDVIKPLENYKYVQKLFSVHREKIQSYLSGEMKDDEMLSFFQKNTTLQNFFLRITVEFGKLKQFKMLDQPAYSWESMVSKVGGCLSLWMGVSIMTMAEVLEFLINLICANRQLNWLTYFASESCSKCKKWKREMRLLEICLEIMACIAAFRLRQESTSHV
ncbi:hypothetical protein HELRODRAFT_167593 [Helobdella robusta]|uniref:Uncharacterized protein n=1 Tax=Helobdella robusta TaxID=6412 RepID=T1EZJ1_HELRO|nr:hypothetical protein HELRODRAFT_167593 [Helobdella robusta]ESO11067.1 hypothetical protein HELRODRAFT_167593 [Helobdella robusta]